MDENNAGFDSPADWVLAAGKLRERGEHFAIATIIAVAGSAPRHSGAKMLITAADIFGSVGGGRLEEDIINRARRILADSSAPPVVVGAASLAASLGQCCGGKVAFVIEKSAAAVSLAVFGAGHIGQSLARIASLLPCRMVFYDSRKMWLDKLADGVGICQCEDMPAAARALPPQSFAIVMTHSHSLDMEVCAAMLGRDDIPFVGLVGSDNKARRFVSQLQERKVSVSRLHCPLGGKARLPGEVAIKMAAYLIDALPQQKRTDAKSEAAQMRELSAMAAQSAKAQTPPQ
ncbi:MAG: xanthine dehydrogenase accessory protein XdhC [Gammaproteobacteria bacterium]